MDFHQSINFQQTNIYHQVNGQEIPTDGCGAKISSNQFLLAGGRTCPNCAFVYNSDSGVIRLVMVQFSYNDDDQSKQTNTYHHCNALFIVRHLVKGGGHVGGEAKPRLYQLF